VADWEGCPGRRRQGREPVQNGRMSDEAPVPSSPDSDSAAQLLSWRELETRTGLDALPSFHRAFLTWRGVEDAAAMPLRRVSQRVEAELNRLVQSGAAQKQEDDWLIKPEALQDFLNSL